MGIEWEAAGIVVQAAAFGEGDALAAVFTEDHGVHRGLARGGFSRARKGTWQPGNLVEARWVARLADQLGSLTAELVHPGAALAMQDATALAVLSSACAVAEGALPEREPYPAIFRGLLHLIVHLARGNPVAELVHWECGVLAELGYGLDISTCAVTGSHENLAFVSPKSGRAVSEDAAGRWRERLFRLPAFLTAGGAPSPRDLADALRITGHFLARDVFGLRHLPLPASRTMLQDRIEKNADASEQT